MGGVLPNLDWIIMLKIGDFAKLAQVSTKTVRYYDQRGLLKPAWIDRYSGYRYYTAAHKQQRYGDLYADKLKSFI